MDEQRIEQLQGVINLLDIANGYVAEMAMKTLDFEYKDALRDCMDKLDNVKGILEDLQV